METNNTWQRVLEEVLNSPSMVDCKTQEEVYKKVEEYLCDRYNTTAGEKIREMAETMTEEIIKKLNIEENT